jgi:hypothetical protein
MLLPLRIEFGALQMGRIGIITQDKLGNNSSCFRKISSRLDPNEAFGVMPPLQRVRVPAKFRGVAGQISDQLREGRCSWLTKSIWLVPIGRTR